MFWPYRPRAEHPSVPRSLFVLVLIAGLSLLVGLFIAIGDDPTDDYGPR